MKSLVYIYIFYYYYYFNSFLLHLADLYKELKSYKHYSKRGGPITFVHI